MTDRKLFNLLFCFFVPIIIFIVSMILFGLRDEYKIVQCGDGARLIVEEAISDREFFFGEDCGDVVTLHRSSECLEVTCRSK